MFTNQEFRRAYDACCRIQSYSSKTDKVAELKNSKEIPYFQEIIKFAFDPNIVSGISQKKLSKNVNVKFKEPVTMDFIDLLNYLETKNTGKDSDIARCQAVLGKYEDDLKEFGSQVITKSLRIGCDVKSINAAYGSGFIREWNVQQAHAYEEGMLRDGEWFSLSEKLNGNHGTYYRGQIISRQGKPFSGLEHIIKEIHDVGYGDWALDGEIIRINSDSVSDNENFRIGTGILNSDGDKSSLKLVVYDMIPPDCLDDGLCPWTYSVRKPHLVVLGNMIQKFGAKNLEVVPFFYEGTDQSKIQEWLDKVDAEGKEGIMLNRDFPYRCTRNNGILKVKKFKFNDLRITAIQEGNGKYKGTLGAFIVDYKGNPLKVGSGISDEQREAFWANQDALIGRVIEVKYKDVSYDKKTGKESVQFPIFVQLREIGKEVSYD